MFSGEGKLTFQVLLIVLYQWSMTLSRFNLYDTDRRFQHDYLQFDCLNYYVRRETRAYQELSDVVDEVIPYCFRPADESPESDEVFNESLHQKLTFESLRLTNIPVQQLLSWSAAMEVIERYQAYLNAAATAKNEYFYNCTPPRFGLRCQYSFEFDERLTFNEVVQLAFNEREAYSEISDMIVRVPCYILLKCHRIGQPWCLDWREVCDGAVDCFDEGTDEQSCFELEINECSDDEFRCHNGLCISQELWEDGEGETDCLDQSDRAIETYYSSLCFQNPMFLCEEHSCRASHHNPFSCGDGQCMFKFQECSNGRHILLLNSMTVQGNLTDECWSAMICLTRLDTKLNEMSCEVWLTHNDTVSEDLEQCGSFFAFPIVPVHSNHIYFFYEDPHLRTHPGQLLLPDYVCYNQQLCDSFDSLLIRDNHTCLNSSEFALSEEDYPDLWIDIISEIQLHFRSCSVFPDLLDAKTNYPNHSSLYRCQNSGKFISKHRIMDELSDCPEVDDENYANSCELNDRYRVTCVNTTICWSPLAKNDACFLNSLENTNKIRFQSVCNGIHEYFYDNNSREYSDEYGCGNWSCDNMYTHCDGFWTCRDGHDESNCIETKCHLQTYPCISSVNYTMMCLPSNFVNDGIEHCIGSLDEQIECRIAGFRIDVVVPFHCSIIEECVQASQICNNNEDCSMGGDENQELCENRTFTCDKDVAHNRDDIERLFCGLAEIENRPLRHFSVRNFSDYPALEEDMIGSLNLSLTDYRPNTNFSLPQIQKSRWPWYCHRGLITFIESDSNNSNDSVCLCPPSYYGHQCQYQNQRLSLTLRLTSNDRYATYAVIVMLMDETDQQHRIHAHHQFVYIAKQSCSMKLNRYLLYPSRPKNISRNYSVRIDIYKKDAMEYIGSWHFTVAFLFLPVNRLSVALSLSNHRLQCSSNCLNTCFHGECIKYVNKAAYFCQCFPQWSGVQCDIPVDCQSCSSQSICIGSSQNRSICVCPIAKYGRECSLTSTCPHELCQNNGQCIPADLTIPGSSHTCICTDRYFGTNCQHRKAQLDVSLDDMNIPSYLVAYFFTLSNRSDPSETTVLRKLTLFQRTVTFHIAISFHLVFIQADDKYYLAALQQSPKMHLVTAINPRQECLLAQRLFNSTVMAMIPYQRLVHFHWFCYTNHGVTCFMDDSYVCLCTSNHLANCMKFNRTKNFICPLDNYCENGGQCLQDHPHCPSTKICLCPSCFFGSQCQFYAKAFGSTLDEILGYEFQRHQMFTKQSARVYVAAVLTFLIFLIGMTSSILASITFFRPKSREVGCGQYLLISSFTSLFSMMAMMLKFWFLFYAHQDHNHMREIEEGNCFGFEMVIKIFVYYNDWLNACVALERTVTLLQGVTFNKERSKAIANTVIICLLIIVAATFVPQFIHLRIFYDNAEERSWCVVRYSKWLAIYSSIFILFHYFAPLIINVCSIACIIFITARQRSVTKKDNRMWKHLRSKIIEHRHILLSSLIIILLTLPHLIISLILNCKKLSNQFWIYLISYCLSFLPAALGFVIFVLPSSLYRKEFTDFVMRTRRRAKIRKQNL